jgi:hypothetical protein
VRAEERSEIETRVCGAAKDCFSSLIYEMKNEGSRSLDFEQNKKAKDILFFYCL